MQYIKPVALVAAASRLPDGNVRVDISREDEQGWFLSTAGRTLDEARSRTVCTLFREGHLPADFDMALLPINWPANGSTRRRGW